MEKVSVPLYSYKYTFHDRTQSNFRNFFLQLQSSLALVPTIQSFMRYDHHSSCNYDPFLAQIKNLQLSIQIPCMQNSINLLRYHNLFREEPQVLCTT